VLRADEANAAFPVTYVRLLAAPSTVLSARLAAQEALADDYALRFQTLATGPQRVLFAVVTQALAARGGTGDADPARGGIPAGDTVAAAFPRLLAFTGVGRFVESKIVSEVGEAVAARQRSALLGAYGVGGGALLLLVVVSLLAIAVGRGVARPLSRLTASAERVAAATEVELTNLTDDETQDTQPITLDPLDVNGRDEIADLARAFGQVQDTATRLVERQVVGRRNVATMFGNVGRRTQNLVGRQLALIDELERTETDADRLRSLYQLNHLSSRLRRNAGSLVVLAGISGGEQAEPMAIGELVRRALAEIEDYDRVEVDVPERLVVVPSVAGDLSLVLAELMENATAYSPPHTKVTVNGEVTHAGARILVVDRGIGLPEAQLAEQNARLVRRERLDLVPTEMLGLFVTGRLARRHGLGVTLTPTPGGGITAVVSLAEAHLVSAVSRAAAVQPADPEDHELEADPWYGSARPELTLAAPATDRPALERATRTIAAGRHWDAFALTGRSLAALPAGPPGPPPAHRPQAAEPPPATWWEPGRRPPRLPREQPDPSAADTIVMDLSELATHDPGKPLQRRVPGATLGDRAASTKRQPAAVAVPSAPMTPADADAARSLIEQIESGVTRALQESGDRNNGGEPR
jgi:signal transduction histidine kinase